MRTPENDPSTGDAGPASADPVPSLLPGQAGAPDGEAWAELGLGDGAGSGGHTLLSRSAAPQGRRSLFRR